MTRHHIDPPLGTPALTLIGPAGPYERCINAARMMARRSSRPSFSSAGCSCRPIEAVPSDT
jgi:hypothetical protein